MSNLRTMTFGLVLVSLPVGVGAYAACERLPPLELSQVTGLALKFPSETRLNVCGGLCESDDGYSCEYQVIGTLQNIVARVYLPPYAWRDGIAFRKKAAGSRNEPIQDVAGVGTAATWQFDPESMDGRGMLYAVEGQRLRVLVTTKGLPNDMAKEGAAKIATLALGRYWFEG